MPQRLTRAGPCEPLWHPNPLVTRPPSAPHEPSRTSRAEPSPVRSRASAPAQPGVGCPGNLSPFHPPCSARRARRGRGRAAGGPHENMPKTSAASPPPASAAAAAASAAPAERGAAARDATRNSSSDAARISSRRQKRRTWSRYACVRALCCVRARACVRVPCVARVLARVRRRTRGRSRTRA
jgi:hypothetical protein